MFRAAAPSHFACVRYTLAVLCYPGIVTTVTSIINKRLMFIIWSWLIIWTALGLLRVSFWGEIKSQLLLANINAHGPQTTDGLPQDILSLDQFWNIKPSKGHLGTLNVITRLMWAQIICTFVEKPSSFICIPSKHKNVCITFVQCWANVEDAGPTLYECYTNVLCLLGCTHHGLTLTAQWSTLDVKSRRQIMIS